MPESETLIPLEEQLAEKRRQQYFEEFKDGALEQVLENNQRLVAEQKKQSRFNRRLAHDIEMARFDKAKLTLLVRELLKTVELDDLTRLLNRKGLEAAVKVLQQKGVSGTVAMLDIDHFKHINDTYGHAEGDEVLRRVASELQRRCRASDLVCRWGGEEFVIYFPEATARQIWEKFRPADAEGAKINIEYDFPEAERGEKVVTVSGGIASLNSKESLEEAVNRADRALYQAKESRNRLVVAEEN